MRGHTKCARLLVEHEGCDVNKATNDGQTALFAATAEGHQEVNLVYAHPSRPNISSSPIFGGCVCVLCQNNSSWWWVGVCCVKITIVGGGWVCVCVVWWCCGVRGVVEWWSEVYIAYTRATHQQLSMHFLLPMAALSIYHAHTSSFSRRWLHCYWSMGQRSPGPGWKSPSTTLPKPGEQMFQV